MYLEVVLDLILEVAGVLLEAASEPGDQLPDVQQLHGVSVVVPARRDVLHTHTHTHTHVRQVRINHPVNLLAGFGGQWTGGRRSCDPTEARERPKLVD